MLAGAAALPDLDVIAFALEIPYGAALGHRGFTHSLLFAAVVAPAVASLAGLRARDAIRPYVVVCFLGFFALASHGILDALTDAGRGVGFFIPLSDERFFFPWRPIMTSPIGVEAFVSRRGLAILANEFVWIVLPTFVGVALVRAVRKSGS